MTSKTKDAGMKYIAARQYSGLCVPFNTLAEAVAAVADKNPALYYGVKMDGFSWLIVAEFSV